MKFTPGFATLVVTISFSVCAMAQNKSDTLDSGVIVEHIKEGSGDSP